MKSIRYFLFSLLSIICSDACYACPYEIYSPKEYYMYRVSDNALSDDDYLNEKFSEKRKNCENWQMLTSESIPIDDIYKVVYKMSLYDFENIYDNRLQKYENKFIEWITKKNSSILDFLLLAKTNEYIRLQCNSRWYYPTMKIGARMTLEEVAEKALSNTDKTLRDRYLLQGIRALFTLGRYEECVSLWESEVSALPTDNLMRKMIQHYVAGAEFRLNHSEKAMTYFAQSGDISSMIYCSGVSIKAMSTVDAIELVCKYDPNNKYIENALQAYVRSIETFCCEDEYTETSDDEKLYSLCINMAKDKRSENPAMWYYTAAFLKQLNNELSLASQLLRLAENSKSTKYIEESIKVLRIYLDAKIMPYNSTYENRLYAQLNWLDEKIKDNIDKDVINETAQGFKLNTNESYYYWNDMMRRILLSEVCPRMNKAGKTTRALQLANMAANRLLNLVNKQSVWVEVADHFEEKMYEMHEYRYSGEHNYFDYSNSFFEMIDSIGLDAVIKYVEKVKKPTSSFDKFLNSRGYTASDYLNDLAGTLCIRNMRYGDAVKYLSNVNVNYRFHQNVYMQFDPFSFDRKKIENGSEFKYDFKYDFAVKMHALEQGINTVSDPNRKAWLMLKYAVGLHNSFSKCWALTQYYKGYTFSRDWENEDYTLAVIKKAQNLIDEACAMVTDDEIAAQMHYELCNFKTVAENYPNTRRGKYVKGKCDNLRDYYNANFQ